MTIDFEGYIGLVADQSAKEALKKLQSVANKAGKSGCDFVTDKCKQIKEYTEQKGKGQITKEEYDGLMQDLSDCMRLEALKMNLASRQLATELIDICLDIAKGGISTLIVF